MSSNKSIIAILMLLGTTPLLIQADYEYGRGTTWVSSNSRFFIQLNTTNFEINKVNDSLKITTYPSTDEFHPCVIPVNEQLMLADSVTVANKIVILLADQHQNYGFKSTYYSIILVNPWLCVPLKTIKIQKYDQVPLSWTQDTGFLLPYKNSFDLFFANQRSCSPCRFSANGERIRLAFSLAPVPGGHAGYELVSRVSGYPRSGYNYTYWRLNDGFEVNLKLNEMFQVLDDPILD